MNHLNLNLKRPERSIRSYWNCCHFVLYKITLHPDRLTVFVYDYEVFIFEANFIFYSHYFYHAGLFR